MRTLRLRSLFGIFLGIAMMTIMMSAAPPPAHATDYTFDKTPEGWWTVESNWNPDGMPTLDDPCYINNGATVMVIDPDVDANCSGAFISNNSTLRIAGGDFKANLQLSLSGGTVVLNSGTFEVGSTGGIVNGSGTGVFQVEGAFNETTAKFPDEADIDQFLLTQAGQFTNAAGKMLILGSLTVQSVSGVSDGKFTQSGGTVVVNNLEINGDYLMSGGTLDVGVAKVEKSAGGSITPSLTMNDAFFMTSDFYIGPSASVSVSGGVFSVSSNFINTGDGYNYFLVTGAPEIDLPAEAGMDILYVTSGGTFTQTSKNKLYVKRLGVDGDNSNATFVQQGEVYITGTSNSALGNYINAGGTLQISEAINISAKNLTIAGDKVAYGTTPAYIELSDGQTLTVSGTLDLGGAAYSNYGNSHLKLSGGTLIVDTGGTFKMGVIIQPYAAKLEMQSGTFELKGSYGLQAGYRALAITGRETDDFNLILPDNDLSFEFIRVGSVSESKTGILKAPSDRTISLGYQGMSIERAGSQLLMQGGSLATLDSGHPPTVTIGSGAEMRGYGSGGEYVKMHIGGGKVIADGGTLNMADMRYSGVTGDSNTGYSGFYAVNGGLLRLPTMVVPAYTSGDYTFDYQYGNELVNSFKLVLHGVSTDIDRSIYPDLYALDNPAVPADIEGDPLAAYWKFNMVPELFYSSYDLYFRYDDSLALEGPFTLYKKGSWIDITSGQSEGSLQIWALGQTGLLGEYGLTGNGGGGVIPEPFTMLSFIAGIFMLALRRVLKRRE